MKFMSDVHEKFVNECCERARNKDCYHRALFYVLGLTEDCRKNIDLLYDWSDGCVMPIVGAKYGWITGTDRRIIRLAYNLYNGGCPTAFDIENPEEMLDETMEYLPSNIFGGLIGELVEYCFEGVRIRYELV